MRRLPLPGAARERAARGPAGPPAAEVLARPPSAELPPPEATGAIAVDGRARTFDCAPTLTDTQVLDFCRTGVLLLPGVVTDDVNARARDYLEGRIESRPQSIPAGMTVDTLERMRGTGEPSGMTVVEPVKMPPALYQCSFHSATGTWAQCTMSRCWQQAVCVRQRGGADRAALTA